MFGFYIIFETIKYPILIIILQNTNTVYAVVMKYWSKK